MSENSWDSVSAWTSAASYEKQDQASQIISVCERRLLHPNLLDKMHWSSRQSHWCICIEDIDFINLLVASHTPPCLQLSQRSVRVMLSRFVAYSTVGTLCIRPIHCLMKVRCVVIVGLLGRFATSCFILLAPQIQVLTYMDQVSFLMKDG